MMMKVFFIWLRVLHVHQCNEYPMC